MKKTKTRSSEEITLDLRSMHKKGRIVQHEGYYFDRKTFRVVLFAFLFFLVVFGLKIGTWGGAYAHCPADAIGGRCVNPLYEKCKYEACQQEFLYAGDTFGEKPPDLWGISFFTLSTFLIAGFLFNHIRQKENKRLYNEQLAIDSKDRRRKKSS